MRYLILLLFISSFVNASPIAVIGDSMTANPSSWANLIDDSGQKMYIMAQPGRSIRDYQMPRDFYAYEGYYTDVVYFIGSSDIYDRTHFVRIERNINEHLSFLLERGFNVIVILPTIYEGRPVESRIVRSVMRRVCQKHGVPFIDLIEVWDSSWTFDGAHPNEYGHRVLADFIYQRMMELL